MPKIKAKVERLVKRFLSAEEAVYFSGRSLDWLEDRRKKGLIAYSQEGRMITYDADSLTDYFESTMVVSRKLAKENQKAYFNNK